MIPLPTIRPRIWPTLRLSNFYGGLNTRDAPTEIANNEAQDLLNIDFTNGGGIAKRGGTNIVGDDKGSSAVLGVFAAYYASSSAQLLMASQSATTAGLWYRTTGNYTEATKDAGATKLANHTVSFANFYDGSNQVIFLADGTSFQKYKPSDNTLYAATASPATVGSFVCVYKNRLYSVGSSSNPERIYFSGLGDGDSWGGSDFFDVPSQSVNQTGKTGDNIMALVEFQNRLIILKARSIWQYDTKQLRLISNNVGCLGKFALVATDNYLYFADNDGVYRLSGTSLQKISLGIQPTWNLIPVSIISKVALGYFKDMLYVAASTTSATANNIILVNYMNLPPDEEGQHPWSYWKGTSANPLAAASFTSYESSTSAARIFVYGHDNAQSATVQLNTGNADYEFTGATQNESIDGYYKTKDFPLSARFKKLFLALKSRTTSYNLNVSALVDFETTRHLQYDMQDTTDSAVTIGKNVSYGGKYINYKFATSASSAQPFMVYDGKQVYKPIRLR